MDQKEMRVMVETNDGQTIWLPASQVEAWKRGQEKLAQGDPEALKRKEQLKSELRRKLLDF